MMTEKEARTKWCPFAHMAKGGEDGGVRHGQTVFNRLELGNGQVAFPHGSLCLVSDCMAWRWRPGNRGYCGLAGKP